MCIKESVIQGKRERERELNKVWGRETKTEVAEEKIFMT